VIVTGEQAYVLLGRILLKKNWRIDESTEKRTIETTTQLNRQDTNSKLP
jgi:hypothetical protein